jgi:hypothetical protein
MIFVSLQGFVPSARFDGNPWTKAIIQEAPEMIGPWTVIETVTLSPIDTDPENPIGRNFSFEGTIANGWYQVVFTDTGATESETSLPIHNVANYVPQISQVGALLRARTKDSAGNETGTFNADTRPTFQQVQELIYSAVGTLKARAGEVIPDQLIQEATRLAALRAAMLVELAYFPEMVATGRSPYAQYEKMWEEGYGDGTSKREGTLIQAITSAQANNDVLVAANPGLAMFSFPVADNIAQRRM